MNNQNELVSHCKKEACFRLLFISLIMNVVDSDTALPLGPLLTAVTKCLTAVLNHSLVV